MKKQRPQSARRPEKPTQAQLPDANNNNQLPVDVKEGVGKVFADSLLDILPPAQAKQVSDRLSAKLPQIISIAATKMHIGPMPSVEVAAGYERLLPGSIDRMFKMAERDQEAFIASHTETMKRDHRFRLCALVCGAFALMAILGVVILLVYMKEPWVAASVAGLGVTGIIAAFVNAGSPMRARAPKETAPKSKDG
jgi:uncharacterized membrane protein